MIADFQEIDEPGPPPEVLAELHQKQTKPHGFAPVSLRDLVDKFPSMRPEIIEGLLRQGETMNIIAPPKTGKSFLVGGLALSVATGRPWLSRKVTQCKVLVIDNELHKETLASRYDRIAFEMQIEESERSALDVISLRGESVNVSSAEAMLQIPVGKYGLIVLDALYRMLPEGTNENDNGAMMRVYNHIDQLARSLESAIVVIHHASKGDQSGKSITDVGAGAGSISRAADSHLVIRPHEQEGLHVLEAVTRSFPSPEPVSVRYEYPLWQAEDCPAKLKAVRSQGEVSQEKNDTQGKQAILDAIPDGRHITKRKLRDSVGMGDGRLCRLLGLLSKDGKVRLTRRRKKGSAKPVEFVSRVGTEAGTEAGTDQKQTS